ncbi:MAG TPA: ATP-dependent DNA helicase, partial [Nevskiaceae bacterium]|nr:ATP-dependent DNA helicase [Nevskiaceae bacterium]
NEGGAMRGDFTAHGLVEWCERRRLARIHRYTRERRHAEVEAVSPAAFMRFLFEWQGLTGEGREGPAALEAILDQLQGFPVAAAAWETDILDVRMKEYDAAWLDALCATGRVAWLRLPGVIEGLRKAPPVRATPVVVLPREQAVVWQAEREGEPTLSGVATDVLAALREYGAMFFTDLVAETRLLRSQVEDALGELVSQGLVTSDGFAGLRALTAPAEIKQRRLRRGGVMGAFQNLEGAGRWSVVAARRRSEELSPEQRTEAIARALLRRYGVVFRKLLERETRLPPWRDLFYVLRRLEARGEIAGGRFVSGFSGEQFALPEAAGALRRHREDRDAAIVSVSACDPLNLAGIVVPGDRVPSQPGNRVVFQGGLPVASRAGKEMRYAPTTEIATQAAWRQGLLRGG